MKTQRILVTGATGKQGGAVTKILLERGHTVRAITRKPDSPAAKVLAAQGAELVVGDLENRASIDRALAGVDAVFSMSTPFEAGVAAETKQGVIVADAAKAAGVFLLYTSVANADRKTGIPHFESKYAVEQHIRSLGARATVIAPVFFMENVNFVGTQLREGVYPSPLTADRKLAQVAVQDIAAAAVAVLEEPDHHLGQRYDLGGDNLSSAESMAVISRISGKPLNYFQMPMEMVRGSMGEDAVLMYQWFQDVGYTVDQAKLRAAFPGVRWTTFEAWAETFDWKTLLAS